MGHSEQYQRGLELDAADDIERRVQEAMARAKSGKATADDWILIDWAVGFSEMQDCAVNTF